jgi:hypothetical protein
LNSIISRNDEAGLPDGKNSFIGMDCRFVGRQYLGEMNILHACYAITVPLEGLSDLFAPQRLPKRHRVDFTHFVVNPAKEYTAKTILSSAEKLVLFPKTHH